MTRKTRSLPQKEALTFLESCVHAAKYVKLPSGDWGVLIPRRSTLPYGSGALVTVTKSSGEEKQEKLGAVMASDDQG